MSDTTYLQIRGGDTEATRIVELSGAAIRVGRGALCEVRLSDPDLAEVQCLLRRRGDTWYIQSIGPAGLVSIDGVAIDHIQPLAEDVLLRVGSFRLLIQKEDRERFRAPIEVGATDGVQRLDGHQEVGRGSPISSLRQLSGPTDGAGRADRLRRWQGRVELRDRWLQARQDEKKWEARWKAAGEGLRARLSPPKRSTFQYGPDRVEVDFQESLDRLVSAQDARSPMTRSVSPTSSDPEPSIIHEPSSSASPSLPVSPMMPPMISRGAEPSESGGYAPRIVRYPPAASKPAPPGSAGESSKALRILSESARSLIVPAGPIPDDRDNPLPFPYSTILMKEGAGNALEDPETRSPFFDSAPAGLSQHRDAVLSEGVFAQEPDPGSASHRGVPTVSLVPPASHPDRTDFPDAATIFAAQGRRIVAQHVSSDSTRRRGASHPVPTHPVEPCRWTLSTWVFLPPVAVAAAGLIGIGISLALTWTSDNLSAGVAARAALRTEKDKPVPFDSAERVETRWWKTTAGHLALWSAAIERSPDSASRVDEVRDALDSARRAAPLEVSARYAMSQPMSGAEASPGPGVGLSRDVASLTLTGRILKRSGKIEPALRAYRRALELAAEADSAWLEPPAFDEDPLIRRFQLPHEEIVGGVIRDMVGSGDWGFANWSSALPPNSVVRLAAGRILREKGSPDAEKAFGLALADDAAIPEATGLAAEHYAAQAEALALTERRDAAADRYRKAIAMTSDDGIRRRWRLSLAEVLSPLGESRERADLLQAAIGNDPAEEVTRKALDAQQFAGLKRTGTTSMPLRSENGR